jgi:tight adherence protein C
VITAAAFLGFGCLFLALSLLVNYSRSRKRLLSRVAGLAPGSELPRIKKSAKRIRYLSKAESEIVDYELTQLVDMLNAILLAGDSLFSALKRLTQVSTGTLSAEFAILLERVELAGELTAELAALCERVPTDAMREFTNKISLAIARGTPLVSSLSSLSTSLRARRVSNLLRKAGVNETKMLIPIVLLICPVTVIFALYPSSQFLTIGFI